MRTSSLGALAMVAAALGCGSETRAVPDAAGAVDAAAAVDARGASADAGSAELPNVGGVTFVGGVSNRYFPLPVGARWIYETVTEEGLERDVVDVLPETRVIQGVVATVVHDSVTLDGVLIEETYDWFAQDQRGAVWYLGEDTCELDEGVCVRHAGSWEWGVGGALPGIVMPAEPAVDGVRYRQEYDPGNAEDVGEVVAVAQTATTPAGMWSDCVKTHDTSTLDLSLDEYKLYCPGVGTVLTVEPDGNSELIQAQGVGGGPTHAEVAQWVEDYRTAHPGRAGDILALSAAEVANDPAAARLRGLCGRGQLPVIPSLAWEYGGTDHAWIMPSASALVYCVYMPVAPSAPHWAYDAGSDRVTADVYVLFPHENPCRAGVGRDTVAGCIGAASNFEILVDTASYHDGADVGLELSEASTVVNLLLENGVRAHLTTNVRTPLRRQ